MSLRLSFPFHHRSLQGLNPLLSSTLYTTKGIGSCYVPFRLWPLILSPPGPLYLYRPDFSTITSLFMWTIRSFVLTEIVLWCITFTLPGYFTYLVLSFSHSRPSVGCLILVNIFRLRFRLHFSLSTVGSCQLSPFPRHHDLWHVNWWWWNWYGDRSDDDYYYHTYLTTSRMSHGSK